MTTQNATTLPESDGTIPTAGAANETLGLLVVSCPAEPWQLGAWAAVTSGEARAIGRGAEPGAGAPRLRWARKRPNGAESCPPFAIPSLSREQLLVRLVPGGVALTNVGRARMLVNGKPESDVVLSNGDIVEVGGLLGLLFLSRAWPPHQASLPGHPFGEADAHGFVGESPAAWALRSRVSFVAKGQGHALIHGPTGSGKELVAQAIHSLSSRSKGPLVARNAATFPEGIIDAELFGNARNYPNPGMAERDGLIGAAHGGTLFLDEFAELPISLQSHLLRVLDRGEYQRLGETTLRTADFRLVGATNRPLSALKHDVAARFTFTVELPSLDDRRDDIPLIARHLLTRARQKNPSVFDELLPADAPVDSLLTPSLVRQLLERTYPAGVRALNSLLWDTLASLRGAGAPPQSSEPRPRSTSSPGMAAVSAPARPSSTPPAPSSVPPPAEPGASAEGSALTPAAVQAALDENNGMIEATWRALGLSSRFVLTRLIKKHGLEIRKRPGRLRPWWGPGRAGLGWCTLERVPAHQPSRRARRAARRRTRRRVDGDALPERAQRSGSSLNRSLIRAIDSDRAGMCPGATPEISRKIGAEPSAVPCGENRHGGCERSFCNLTEGFPHARSLSASRSPFPRHRLVRCLLRRRRSPGARRRRGR